jgi:SanA protein
MARVRNYTLLTLLAAAGACVCLTLYVVAATYSSIKSAANVPQTQVAVVLGASVTTTGVLSQVLQERADAALMLYRAHKVEKILVTGDNSTLEHNEVYPVGKYLLAAGVPQRDIFLDYAGFDTYSSMYRARAVFGVQSMTIVSQRFHLPRALFIAHTLGLSAYGVDVSGNETYIINSLREIPATAKAAADLLFGRVPQYLGDTFPITGDGSQTWVGDTPNLLYFKHG